MTSESECARCRARPGRQYTALCAECHEWVTEQQRWIGTSRRGIARVRSAVDRTPQDYRRTARWWELEALRGYECAEESRQYGRNMRWAAELAGIYGPGTWLELKARQDG